MQIRDNVRERRRERIQQLIGQRAIEETTKSEKTKAVANKSNKTVNEASGPDIVKA
jgi:hypothetical protein